MNSGARVVAVDLARGIALAGMMLAHLGPGQIGDTPPVNEILSSGRAAPLFALLAGVSMSLVQRRDPHGVGSVYATWVRGVLLVLLGLSLGSLRDVPVLIILTVYGLLIVAALPLRGLATRTLMLLTAAWAVLASVGLLALRIHHDPVVVEQPSWSDVQDPWRLIGAVLFWGGYPAVVWMTYVLAGLVLGRLDLTDLTTAARLTSAALVMLVVPLVVAWSHVREWRALFAHGSYPYGPVGWSELWVVGPHTSMPLNVISATGSAALVLGLSALVMRADLARRAAVPVCAAGAMTLTLYTVHVLWTWRLRLDADVPALGSWGGWSLQVIVLFSAAWLWRRVLGRGPFEQIVRWVSLLLGRRGHGRTTSGQKKTPALD